LQAFADVKDNSDSGKIMAISKRRRPRLDRIDLSERIRENIAAAGRNLSLS